MSVHRLLLEWRLDPGVTADCLAAAACYLWGAVRVRRWPAARTTAFLAGLGLIALALESGLHAQAERLLSAHMVQHLVLTMVAAPLLVLGAPVTLALRALPPGARRALARLLSGRAAGALLRPAVAWGVFAAVMVGTHAPPFYDAALRSYWVHGLEHVSYLAASVLFWLPLLGTEPLPHAPSPGARILTLLLAMPPMALVGVALLTASDVVYGPYRATGALADQHDAGMVMWVGGTLVLVAATLVVGWAALRREEERQRARESYADARRAA